MTNASWKAAERAHARDVGTQRIPVTGERDGADFTSGLFGYQLKVRKVIPKYLFDWLDGVRRVSERRHQIGVLVLNRPRRPRRDALVVVRWSDWIDLHGEPPGGDEE